MIIVIIAIGFCILTLSSSVQRENTECTEDDSFLSNTGGFGREKRKEKREEIKME